MIKQRKRLVDVETVAFAYGVSKGTIARWASLNHWTPYGTARARLWDLNEAQATYDRLHPPHAHQEAS